jgi:hypothetical protein
MGEKILVVGDTHGMASVINGIIERTKHLDYSKIIQVGDFGLWPGERGVTFLDDINEKLRLHGRKLYAIAGNHDWHPMWNMLTAHAAKDQYGFAFARSHVLLAPRIHRWSWAARSFQSVAGAVSIDRDSRVLGRDWWLEEQITDWEIATLARLDTDFMFTHDCSNRTPWGFQLIPDHQSQIHRQRIDQALSIVQPRMHFHGHMHKKFDWMNRVSDDGWVQTYGLTCNGYKDSVGLLDLATREFEFVN